MTDSLALPPPTFCHPLGVPTFPVLSLSFHGCSSLFRFLFFFARVITASVRARKTLFRSPKETTTVTLQLYHPPPAGTRCLLLLARFARNRAETSEAARRGSLEDSVARGCTATRTRVLLCKHARFSPPLLSHAGRNCDFSRALPVTSSPVGGIFRVSFEPQNSERYTSKERAKEREKNKEKERERRTEERNACGENTRSGGRKSCRKNAVTELTLALFTGYI